MISYSDFPVSMLNMKSVFANETETNENKNQPEKNQTGKLEKSKWNLLKETFIEFSQRTDINAYGKIFEYENYWAKFIWLIILLGSLSLTAFVMGESVLAYLQYDVVSQIEVVYETPTEFPTVTFCDNRPFTTKEFPPDIYHEKKKEKVIDYGKMIASKSSYGDENRKSLGLNIKKIFSLDLSKAPCIYNSTNCTNDLNWYWSYDYGNCFQFNVGLNYSNDNIDIKKSNRAGADNGLQIMIVPLVNNNSFTKLLPSGVVLFVHNSSMRPLKSDGIFLETGKRTFISVKRTFVTNSPSPFTSCQDLSSYSSRLYNFIINSKQYSKYRQQDCFNLCIQESIISQCNCSYSGFDNPYGQNSTVEPCLTPTDYSCFTSKFYDFDPTECASNSCPLECESIEYDLSVTSLIEPSIDNQIWRNYFCFTFSYLCSNGSIDYETYKSYVISFTVYYPTLSYTQLSTTPAMTLVSLFANLGGSMGLIVSVSVFTLFELAELFVLLVHVLLFKQSNKVQS